MQFVFPSRLAVRGNRDFFDNGERYLAHPSEAGEYTFGALFLEKR